MNDQNWEGEEEFWDNEIEDDDEDDCNDLGSNIDANNDETFNNASRWDEDEHEKLIERDFGRPQVKHKPEPSSEPIRQVLRVDELEKQFVKTNISPLDQMPPRSSQHVPPHLPETSRRTGWSPFGGKDLFNSSQTSVGLFGTNEPQFPHLSKSMTLEQQQLFIIHQQQLLEQQRQQLNQLEIMKQRHQQQIQQQQLLEIQRQSQVVLGQKVLPQCFRAEDIERQMLADARSTEPIVAQCAQELVNRSNSSSNQERLTSLENLKSDHKKPYINEHQKLRNHDRRNGERYDKFDKNHRDNVETRDHRDRRDHRRDHFQRRNRGSAIIPPQVQLSVINKSRRLYPAQPLHHDQYLGDRMPTSEGFQLKRHSTVINEKSTHDGVLTENERNWLIKVQTKIQADSDDNWEQDYYYLLYFNRSSANDEASQKPCGPSVPDKRFVPRERLLYNSGV